MIHFTCPHCQKHYEVKDELAGKKTKCLRCEKVISVPETVAAAPAPAATTSAPAASASTLVPTTTAPAQSTPAAAPPPDQALVDVEALAAAALADEPAPAAVPEPTTIDFQCPFCDAKVSLSSTLAGKRSPCPECRRIIKVPELQKQEPIDWRKRDTRLPSGARQAVEQAAPEGAWGTATSTAHVSQQALVEAAAIPEVKERLTPKQWAQRIGMAVAAVALAAGAFMLYLQKRSEGRQQKALELALEYLPPEKGEKKDDAKGKLLSPVAAAEVRRALAEYHFNANKPEDALKQLQKARALTITDKTAEGDAVLLEIALLQVELGGDKDEVDQGKRLKWEQVAKDLQPTLREIQSSELRLEAFRSIARRLVLKGQGPRAVGLASPLAPTGQLPEYMALVGLEMLGSDSLQTLVDGALRQYPQSDNKAPRPAVAPSLIALLLVLDAPDKARRVAPEPTGEGESDVLARLGYAEGHARRGELAVARKLALAGGPAEIRLQALAPVASVALERNPEETKDLQTALELVKEAQRSAATSLALWRLVRSAARAGQTKLAQDLAAAILDPALRGRAQLEIFRARLKASNDRIDFATVEEVVDKQSPAYGVALEEWSRHNTRHGGSSDVLKAIESWEPEALRPLGYIGVALGEQR